MLKWIGKKHKRKPERKLNRERKPRISKIEREIAEHTLSLYRLESSMINEAFLLESKRRKDYIV